MAIDISGLKGIAGFLGACLVDAESGLMLSSEGGGKIDLESAAATNAEFLRSKLAELEALDMQDYVEDILVTLGKQMQLIRPLEKNPTCFIYVVLDRKVANLGMARIKVRDMEKTLSV